MMDFRWIFFVVRSGNPSARSNRIWYPNTDRVPVPVRSPRSMPLRIIWSSRSRYCFIVVGGLFDDKCRHFLADTGDVGVYFFAERVKMRNFVD